MKQEVTHRHKSLSLLSLRESKMDRRLFEACLNGNLDALQQLAEEDELLLSQVTLSARATPLHLASRLGHAGLASELLRLRPAMASAENVRGETPLHEACREGHAEVARVLLDFDPTVVRKLNGEGVSALSLACRRGHLGVVRLLLNGDPSVLLLEDDASFNALHSAAIGGHAEIMHELLKAQPYLATKVDKNGFSPLHHACWKGHLNVTRELLQFNSDLCSKKDQDGRTPLHLAALKGWSAILDEILSVRPDIAELLTNEGENVLHLSVKNNHLDAFEYLIGKLGSAQFNIQDCNGNTILHLATSRKHVSMVERILEKKIGDVNALNRKGCTALDLIPENDSNADALSIRLVLLKAGAERSRFSERAQGNTASENYQTSELRHQLKFDNQEEVFPVFSEEARGSVCLSVIIAATLLVVVLFSGSFSNPDSINQHGAVARFLLKILAAINDLALLASVGIVMALTTLIFFRPKSRTEHVLKIYSSAYVTAAFTILAYASSRFVILLPGIGYRKWMLLPICMVSPSLLFLFFWQLKQREIAEADQGTEVSTIARTTGVDMTEETKKTM